MLFKAVEEEKKYEEERNRMVELLRVQGIREEVLEAMKRVPRHLFVPSHLKHQAYIDHPLPIGENQTISAPHMVAMMCDYLELKKGDKVLEIGAGSGYHAAVITEIIGEKGHVYTIEKIKSLVLFSKKNLERAKYKNVAVIHGDGTRGLIEYAPYDRICVTCGAPDVPIPLIEQLSVGGKMVIPIGKYMQVLYVVEKKNGIEKKKKCDVMFVPLIGKYGFPEESLK